MEEEELCAKLCGVLISFQEIMKLQSFEFGVSDIIPANVQNIFTPSFISIFFIIPRYFIVFFTIFSRNYEATTSLNG